MKKIWVIAFILVCVLMQTAQVLGQSPKEVRFDGINAKIVTSYNGADLEFKDATITIAGRLFDNYADIDQSDAFITSDVRGWNSFTGYIGIRDDYDRESSLSIEVDGEVVLERKLQHGTAAERIQIPLSGHKTMTIRTSKTSAIIAEPKLVKGIISPNSSVNSFVTTSTASGTSVKTTADFVVDPNDIEKLSAALRKRVDAKPELKDRIATGNVALVTFTMVDIASSSVATNVAEDLYTSLINIDFPLVERGQLDKVLKELKIQDTALIDPTTAKKIGQLSGCDMIVLGSISDRGNFVVINARLMDTATGKSLAAERVEMRKIVINR